MVVIGVDIGVNGALAVIENGKTCIDILKMPDFKTRNGLEELERFVNGRVVYIERPLSLKGQNNVQTNINYGLVLGCMIKSAYSVFEVMPKVWTSHYGLTNDKKTHIRTANSLIPNIKHKNITHDEADALLIGRYGCYIETLKKNRKRAKKL